MTVFYNNVFINYRDADQESSGRDKSVEENFTQVFINPLCQAGGVVRKRFLEWLGGHILEDGIVRYDMQRGDIGESRITFKKNRFLQELVPENGRFELMLGASRFWLKFRFDPRGWLRAMGLFTCGGLFLLLLEISV